MPGQWWSVQRFSHRMLSRAGDVQLSGCLRPWRSEASGLPTMFLGHSFNTKWPRQPPAFPRTLLETPGFFFLFSPKFLRVDQDKDKDCSLDCAGSAQKPLCASDGRTFLSRCEFQRAKCKDPQLEIAYRGNCKGKFPSITCSRAKP